MTPVAQLNIRSRRFGQIAPLHVVHLSRDTDLLRPAPGSEPVERQLGYARALEERAPGSRVTILVQTRGQRAEGWQLENLRIVPVEGTLGGSVGCLQVLHALHKTDRIGVLTTQVPYDEAWLALTFGAWYGIPVIGQIHSDLFAEHPAASVSRRVRDTLRSWAARRTLAAFAVVRTVSSESRTSIARFAARVPLTTIPVPVPMAARGGRNGTPKQPLVIFVGRLAPEKELRQWLRVARAVWQQHPEARFEIVGDGIEREQLQREAEMLGLGRVLSFTGFVRHEQLREIYARASVLLLTSKTEGFGRVLVEAASQGTAAVSTALAGPRDIIINGVTGFLHEPGDIAGLARSVSLLVREPQRATIMGAQARTLVTAKFDPERLRAAWVDLWVTTARGRVRAR
jgi:glycosyltransferase involved in cell wall biosynthesis